MKTYIEAVAVAALIAVPAVSFAQVYAPVTRAEVHAQLVQSERAGFHPGGQQEDYPQNIQATQAGAAAQQGGSTGYGGVEDGLSVSGAHASAGVQRTYFDY